MSSVCMFLCVRCSMCIFLLFILFYVYVFCMYMLRIYAPVILCVRRPVCISPLCMSSCMYFYVSTLHFLYALYLCPLYVYFGKYVTLCICICVCLLCVYFRVHIAAVYMPCVYFPFLRYFSQNSEWGIALNWDRVWI